MKLARRIVANVASQSYVAVLGIVVLPVYLQSLGSEAFGLVALSFTLQAWFVILDFGLAPTVTRAAATCRAGMTAPEELRQILRTVVRIYLAIGVGAAVLLSFAVALFSERWFRHETLTANELRLALLVMSFVIALRWLAELLRGVHAGFERFVWLGKFNAAIATLRFLLVVPLLLWTTMGIVGFFMFQLLVALLECAALSLETHRVLPAAQAAPDARPISSLCKLRHFTLTMALAGICWVLVSQTDKLLLSGLMTLSEFGRFTLATTAAGAVLLVTSPLSAVVVARMTALVAQSDRAAFERLYRDSTQWIGLLAWPAAAMLTWHAERILLAWTGNTSITLIAAPVLQLYAVGNACLAVSAVAYAGQFARGDLKLHVLGSAVFLLVLLPLLAWSTSNFGPMGAGWVWLLLNAAYLLFWLMLTHRIFGPCSYGRWFVHDVLPLALLAFATAAIGLLLPWSEHRFWLTLQIAMLSLLTLVVTPLGASWARDYVRSWLSSAGSRRDSVVESLGTRATGGKRHE